MPPPTRREAQTPYQRLGPQRSQTNSVEFRVNSKEFDLNESEIKSNEFHLTTFDNPFNPFENFRSWFAFDQRNHYNSLSLLARIVVTTGDLGPFQEKLSIVQGMHDIVRLNASGNHFILVQPSSQVPYGP